MAVTKQTIDEYRINNITPKSYILNIYTQINGDNNLDSVTWQIPINNYRELFGYKFSITILKAYLSSPDMHQDATGTHLIDSALTITGSDWPDCLCTDTTKFYSLPSKESSSSRMNSELQKPIYLGKPRENTTPWIYFAYDSNTNSIYQFYMSFLIIL